MIITTHYRDGDNTFSVAIESEADYKAALRCLEFLENCASEHPIAVGDLRKQKLDAFDELVNTYEICHDIAERDECG